MALRIDTNHLPDANAPVNANDFKQFAALRRGAQANDPATLREVAKQFESLFTKMMLQSMRDAVRTAEPAGRAHAEVLCGVL